MTHFITPVFFCSYIFSILTFSMTSFKVDSPRAADSGVYECQVSTQPKIFRRFFLFVVSK